MIRVGVIGTGIMGQHHVRVYSSLPGVELVGISDSNEDTLYAVAKKYNTKAFLDYNELLKQNLDAVSVVVPTSLHHRIAIDVANAGVNMLVEKPIADTVENAKKIISACEKSNVKLMVGHIERFNPVTAVIKKAIEGESVVSIVTTRVGPLPPRIKDVGVVIDLAIHDIDLIRYITQSEFEKTFSSVSKNFSDKEDAAILCFKMRDGTLANVIADWLTPFKVREIKIATKTKFLVGDLLNQKVTEYTHYSTDGSYVVRNLPVSYEEPLRLELIAFVKCVEQNTEPNITGYDALKALEIAVKVLAG